MAFTKVTDNLLSSGVGTGAGNILELDSSGKLPAVDGSLLTNLPAGGVDGIVSTADATAITIDSNENVGIGVTPESWQSTLSAIQVGGNGSLHCLTAQGASSRMMLANNIYVNSGGADKAISTDEATNYVQRDGTHKFQVASSTSADVTISWTTAMTIDTSGRVMMPNQPSFRSSDNDSTTAYSATNIYKFNNGVSALSFNTGNHYSTSTGKFTAPVAGVYSFHASIGAKAPSGSTWGSGSTLQDFFQIRKNGVGHTYSHKRENGDTAATANGYFTDSGSCLMTLAVNDTVDVKVNHSMRGFGNGEYTYFEGHLIG